MPAADPLPPPDPQRSVRLRSLLFILLATGRRPLPLRGQRSALRPSVRCLRAHLQRSRGTRPERTVEIIVSFYNLLLGDFLRDCDRSAVNSLEESRVYRQA